MKLKLEREKCIGCGSCAALCSKFFEIIDDGKSHLKNSEKKEIEEIEIEKADCAEEAKEACPVQCISIIK